LLRDYEANHVPVRTECVLRTTYAVMYAFRSNTELVPVFQSTRTLVPAGILAESSRNVPPSIEQTTDLLRMSVVVGELFLGLIHVSCVTFHFSYCTVKSMVM
jgi:hypothetical protein